MRAQLDTESLLTGLLFVDLDLHPNAPLDLALVPGSGSLREIPTVQTNLEQIQKQTTDALAKLDHIDLNKMVASITNAARLDQPAHRLDRPEGYPHLAQADRAESQPHYHLTARCAGQRQRTNYAAGRESPAEFRRSELYDEGYARGVARGEVQPRPRLAAFREPKCGSWSAGRYTRSIEELTNYLQRNPAALVRGKYVREKDR